MKCISLVELTRGSLVILGDGTLGDMLSSDSEDEPISEACRSKDFNTLRVLFLGLRLLFGLSSELLSSKISWRCWRLFREKTTGLFAPLVKFLGPPYPDLLLALDNGRPYS